MGRLSGNGTWAKPAVLLALLGVLGCVATPKAPRATHVPVTVPLFTGREANPGGAARWVILPGVEREVSSLDSAGTLRLIAEGIRIEIMPSGSVKQSRDQLPLSPVRTLELPDRLGGGFLFHTDVERATWIWRSDTYTSPLLPLGRVEPTVREMVAGFDRVYLLSGQHYDTRAIDPRSGEPMGLGPLPSSPGFYSMAFATPWLAGVNSDVFGLLVTHDAGASWSGLDLIGGGARLTAQGGALLIRSVEGSFRLSEDGSLSQIDVDGEFDEEQDRPSFPGSQSPAAGASPGLRLAPELEAPELGDSPLRLAVLHGFPEAPGRAVFAARGSLVRVSLDDGRILTQRAHAYRGRQPCHPLYVGTGYGFVCDEGGGQTTVYEYGRNFDLRPVLEFASARRVYPSFNGGLVIAGSCRESVARVDTVGLYCLRDRRGRLREVQSEDSLGNERVASLHDGRALLLFPPRADSPGRLRLVDDGGVRDVPLDLSGLEPAQARLLVRGLWLSGMAQVSPTQIATWVVGPGPFVGVRIRLDGKVKAGPIRESISHALIAGPRSVLLTNGGVGYETTSHGEEWRPFRLPSTLEVGPASETVSPDSQEPLGCTGVGCALGRWLRIGFGEPGQSLSEAAEPKPIAHFAWGLGHFSLQCQATGRRALRGASRVVGLDGRGSVPRFFAPRGDATAGLEIESSSFVPFLGTPPPRHRETDLVLDLGHDERRVQFRAYAWGPKDASWSANAGWVVRVADRFQLDSLWSTALSRIPWDDPLLAAQTFGQDPQAVSSVDWALALDGGGEAGLLRVRARSASELYLLEKDRTIVPLRDGGDLDVQRLGGIARVRGQWYFGVQLPSSFRIYRVLESTPELLGEYPEYAADAVRTQVVASREGDALGLWVKSRTSGWHIFPIDPSSGNPAVPLHVTPPALHQVPRACRAEDQGWELVTEAPLSSLSGAAGNVTIGVDGSEDARVQQLEARVVAHHSGLCLAALAGQLEPGSAPLGSSANGGSGKGRALPLILTDRTTDERHELRCSP